MKTTRASKKKMMFLFIYLVNEPRSRSILELDYMYKNKPNTELILY